MWWESREYAQGDSDLTQMTLAVVRQITPQLEARFRHAFPQARIAVLHSALQESARTQA